MSKGHAIARAWAEQLAEQYIGEHYPSTQVEVGGSIRRQEPEVRDIDLIVLAPKLVGKMVKDEIDGVSVNVWFSNEKSWPAMLLFVTGPAQFNIVCRTVAKRHGLKLNQYGLFRSSGRRVSAKTEDELLVAIGRTPRRPEERKR